MKCIVNNDVVLSQPLVGPLSMHIVVFAKWTREEGYARPSRWRKVIFAARLSRWLGQQAVSVCNVTSEHAPRYLRSQVGRVQIRRGDAVALRQFIDLLRRHGVVPQRRSYPAS